MNNYTGYDNLEIMAAAVNYNRFLMSLILNQMHSGKKVLDIGAGIGTFAKNLSTDGYEVLCFEPDVKQLDVIKSKGLSIVKSLEDIEKNSLDFIYSLNVLEHIEDDIDALRMWLSLLKPGGRILIYVPAFQLLYSSMDKKVGHIRRYRKQELIEKSKMVGFRIVKAEYADSIGFLASIVYKYLNNGSGDINQSALKLFDRYVFPLSRALDTFTHPIFGKNVFLVVERELPKII